MAQFNIKESQKKSFYSDDNLDRGNRNNILGNKSVSTRIRSDAEIDDTSLKLQKDYRNSTSEMENVMNDMDRVTQDFYETSGLYYNMNDYVEEVDESYATVNLDIDGARLDEYTGSTSSTDHLNAKKQYILDKMNKWFEKNPQEKGSPQGGFRGYEYYENLRRIELQDLERESAIQQKYNDGSIMAPTAIGSIKGIFQDPLIWETMAAGFVPLGQGGILLQATKFAVTESILASTTELAIQTKVVPYNQQLGSDYSWSDAAKVIAMAGGGGFLIGGALGGTIAALGKGYSKAFNALPFNKAKRMSQEIDRLVNEAPVLDEKFADRLIDYINESITKFTSSEKRILLESLPDDQKGKTIKTVEKIYNAEEIIEESNPLLNTPKGRVEHRERVNRAGESLVSDTEVKINDETITPVDYTKNFDSDFNVYREVRIDPDDIGVEPDVFQFKKEAIDPTTGLSPKLKGITEWDQDAANVVMVFEYADGRKVIADGHQRLALAKRIKKLGKQKPYLLATVRREADGHTPEETMVAAMMINVQQETASATDVAKILRLKPDYINNIKGRISPRSVLWENSEGLSKLSPEAWQYYLNNKVSDKIAAAVGNIVDDPELQVQVMNYIAKNNFANIDQAKLAIQDILNQGTTTREVQDLFGTQLIKELLIKERAEILDKAIRELKKDKSIASFLISNEEKIIKKGNNKLDSDFNKQVLDESALSIEKIIKLANMKGEISNELNIAAKIFKDGNKQEAIRTFKEAITTAIRRGDLERVTPGGTERGTLSEGYTQTQPKNPKPTKESINLNNQDNPHDGNIVYKDAKDDLQNTMDSLRGSLFGNQTSSATRLGERSTASTSTPPGEDLIQAEVKGSRVTTAEPPSTVFANATANPLKSLIEVDSSIGDLSSISGLKILQITDDVEQLYAIANRSLGSISKELQSVSKKLDKSTFKANLKDKDTLLNNVKMKKITHPGASAAHEPDIARGKITVTQLGDIPKVIEDVKSRFKVVSFKNTIEDPTPLGYRAVHLQLVTKDGLGFELQIHHKELDKLFIANRKKPGGYESFKGRTDLTPEEDNLRIESGKKDFNESEELFTRISGKEKLSAIDENYQVATQVTEEGIQTQSLKNIMSDLNNDDDIINRLALCPGIK